MIEILKEKIEKSFSMNDDLWEDLQKKAKKKVVKKGEVLISYSSNQQIISCIVAGSFEMSLINANGDHKIREKYGMLCKKHTFHTKCYA